MKHALLALLTYIAAALQASGHFQTFAGRGPIQLLPLAIVLAVFLHGDWRAVVWAGLIGLASDCLKPNGLGIDMLSAVLVAAFAVMLQHRRSRMPGFLRLLLGAGAVVLFCLLSAALSMALAEQTSSTHEWIFGVVVHSSGSITAGAVLLLAWNAVRPVIPRSRSDFRAMNS